MQKRRMHRFLIVINGLLVLSSVHIFLFYRSAEQFYLPFFSEINWAIPLLYGLLLWLYTRSLVETDFKMAVLDKIHFLPFIFFTGYLIIPLLAGQANTYYLHHGYPWLKLLVNPLYLVAVVVILKKHERMLKDKYSFIGKMHHYWLSSLAIGGLVLWFISCVSLIHHAIQPEASTIAGDYIVLSVLSIYLFAMSYVGFSKTEIFQNRKVKTENQPLILLSPQIEIEAEVTKDILDETIIDKPEDTAPNSDSELYQRLLSFMDSDKPYLNPALSLNDLSQLSKISATKLSALINQQGNKNFYDFINTYRVQAVVEALERGDTQNYSLLGISEACGFNSKATFYRIFKKATGVTPAQYAKKR